MQHNELMALLTECGFTRAYAGANVRHFAGVKARLGMTTMTAHIIEPNANFCITAKTDKTLVWRMELSNNIPRPVLKHLLKKVVAWCTDDAADPSKTSIR